MSAGNLTDDVQLAYSGQRASALSSSVNDPASGADERYDPTTVELRIFFLVFGAFCLTAGYYAVKATWRAWHRRKSDSNFRSTTTSGDRSSAGDLTPIAVVVAEDRYDEQRSASEGTPEDPSSNVARHVAGDREDVDDDDALMHLLASATVVQPPRRRRRPSRVWSRQKLSVGVSAIRHRDASLRRRRRQRRAKRRQLLELLMQRRTLLLASASASGAAANIVSSGCIGGLAAPASAVAAAAAAAAATEGTPRATVVSIESVAPPDYFDTMNAEWEQQGFCPLYKSRRTFGTVTADFSTNSL